MKRPWVDEIEKVWAADDAVIIAMHRNPFCTIQDILRVIPRSEGAIRGTIEAYRRNGWRNPRTEKL